MHKVIFLENKLRCFVFSLTLFTNARNINMHKLNLTK
ncbi:hypothetical protein ECSTECDG1313_5451, partial [Escherichia coli STEC_DG131-3]